ncbi:MAG: HEPN domain-containing protein [Planctomycetota bacterium]|nr:HEPN domain-containing protein [Planctomycetota bacterium]
MDRDRAELLLHKAKQDELALEKLLDDQDIEDDLLGFHAQQAAEKMLKALLVRRAVDYPKTHNIRVLIELLAADGIAIPGELAEIDTLTQFGTTFRYDTLPPAGTVERATWLSWIRTLRRFIEPLLG